MTENTLNLPQREFNQDERKALESSYSAQFSFRSRIRLALRRAVQMAPTCSVDDLQGRGKGYSEEQRREMAYDALRAEVESAIAQDRIRNSKEVA